jgi:hypothetical protein
LQEVASSSILKHHPAMKFWTLPKLEYPVTHEFEGKLFNRITYAAAFLALVILAIVNGAY